MKVLNLTKQQWAAAEAFTKMLMPDGELIIKPYEFFRGFDPAIIRTFQHFQGIYCLPTQELIDWLRKQIGDQSAIEIGCGVGRVFWSA